MTCCSNNTSPANKVLLWLLKIFDGGWDLTNTKIKTEIPQEKGVSKRSADSSGGLVPEWVINKSDFFICLFRSG